MPREEDVCVLSFSQPNPKLSFGPLGLFGVSALSIRTASNESPKTQLFGAGLAGV